MESELRTSGYHFPDRSVLRNRCCNRPPSSVRHHTCQLDIEIGWSSASRTASWLQLGFSFSVFVFCVYLWFWFSPEALNWLLIRGLLGCFVICNAESDIASSGYHCWTLWHMQGIIRRVVLACIWTGSVELLILFFMPWTCLFMRGSLLGEDCEGRTLSRESTLER
ncbi:hypothetical protein ACFX2F_032098 [Malus domestica]